MEIRIRRYEARGECLGWSIHHAMLEMLKQNQRKIKLTDRWSIGDKNVEIYRVGNMNVEVRWDINEGEIIIEGKWPKSMDQFYAELERKIGTKLERIDKNGKGR